MSARSRKSASPHQHTSIFAPRIYYFHPLLAGAPDAWQQRFALWQKIGFDYLLCAPLFASGARGDIFLAADHERVHPALGPLTVDDLTKQLAEQCQARGLQLLLDVVLGRVAADSDLATRFSTWFHTPDAAQAKIDPRSPIEPDAAFARFDEATAAKELTAWWIERLSRLVANGAAGFACREPHLVPPGAWREIIASVRKVNAACKFLAWTAGLDWRQLADLRDVGFSGAFSSTPWWDGRATWFIEEYELLRGFGAVIGCAEAPFGPRLARRAAMAADPARLYRHTLQRAAATGSGILVPIGFERGAAEDMERTRGAPQDLEAAGFLCPATIEKEIRAANDLCRRLATLGVSGEMRALTEPQQAVTALLRCDAPDARYADNCVVVLINTDLENERAAPIGLDPLPPAAGAALMATKPLAADAACDAPLAAAEVRLIEARASKRIKVRPPDAPATKLAALPRLVVANVSPAVDNGRFPAKSIIGAGITVEADVFSDGHEQLASDLLWRSADENTWRRVPMSLLANDRWQALLAPRRIGRHEFTIEAWRDEYGTLCRDIELKHHAGADTGIEIAEGRALLQRASKQAQNGESEVLRSALHWLGDATRDESLEILLASDLRELMRSAVEPEARYRHQPILAVEIERPQAAFAAWYELFPRSAAQTPGRHGTLADVIARLPAIRDMGFDVLYLPPIHPIGHTNRKGRNNAVRAEAGDVGSPYAIGDEQGGHDAIHPDLGTLEDFRRLRDAAAAHGIELALDFAVQCSPDHPWLKQHPEWFNWRPDGSVRYAENPPKKYEDIVNVDFYAPGAIRELWTALRDVVLFWVGEGVQTFRVDNPHTKPLPFWEWLIAQVRARHPDVIFLAEAFTRPKMMYRLAQAGFSQSYTYFTWRNTKQELTDYFVELTTTEVKNFFRPHLFVNTPDINPYFLQTSGRPGFLIRAALAATLSGLWGVYSGFELCEAAPLPGREEYLDSEKYEIKSRRFDAPGNIVAEIAKLNRIRKSHPALQSHLGLRFYPAHNDQVILYGKPLPAREDMILTAVSLDPFHPQEVTIEVPLWEWNLPDNAAVDVEDLFRGHRFAWHGKLQRVRFDPHDLPFAIWRIAPRAGG